MLKLKSHTAKKCWGVSLIILLVISLQSQMGKAGPPKHRTLNLLPTSQSPTDEIVIEEGVRSPDPYHTNTGGEPAPSIRVRQGQSYDVRWQVPSVGRWYIILGKKPSSNSDSNDWEEYKFWLANSHNTQGKVIGHDLGPEAKCLITVWYNDREKDMTKGNSHPSAVPFLRWSQSTSKHGRTIKEFGFEFKFEDSGIARVIFSRPAA
jgi:hypothetical protein